MAGEVKSALKSCQNNGLPVGINNDPRQASSLFLMDFSKKKKKEKKEKEEKSNVGQESTRDTSQLTVYLSLLLVK